MMGVPVHINIEEIRKPDLDARLVAQNVAQQLERRVMFRRAMKRVVQNAMRQGAEGYQGAGWSVVWAALKSRVQSGIAKVACRCTPCVPISTTRLMKRIPLTAYSASKCGSSKVRVIGMPMRASASPSGQLKPG